MCAPEFKDYCEREFFKAKCAAADEVVVIRLARYGRMREGRCVTNAYEVLGCSQDVRDVLDLQWLVSYLSTNLFTSLLLYCKFVKQAPEIIRTSCFYCKFNVKRGWYLVCAAQGGESVTFW